MLFLGAWLVQGHMATMEKTKTWVELPWPPGPAAQHSAMPVRSGEEGAELWSCDKASQPSSSGLRKESGIEGNLKHEKRPQHKWRVSNNKVERY